MGKANVCLFLEGTYPYVLGGVSGWAHDLITSQPHLSFYLVCILAPDAELKMRYELPKNVVGMSHVYLQDLPVGSTTISHEKKKEFFEAVEIPFLHLQHKATLQGLKVILDRLHAFHGEIGSDALLDSEEAWKMIQRMYLSTMGETSFLDYFWSWRGLLGGFYSIMLADLPEADIYHTLCTGYAGLFLARAFVETGHPCLTTEHGIYTNERRIEILSAQWLLDSKAQNLNVERSRFDKDLKDFWVDTFVGYSRLTYEASTKIVTLFEGNKALQIEDKADVSKIIIIPNGINVERYSKLERNEDHPPTIALIGRVVPIKDVKTFIHATGILKQKIPQLRAFVMGPTDEDPDYYEECIKLVEGMQLEDVLTFTGKVQIDTYLPEIDIVVLSSISEAQPLILLEAGASGIPCVATHVGACSEIVHGSSSERPHLGRAGSICQVSNPVSLANEAFALLTDENLYKSCSQVIQERVKHYYNHDRFKEAYRELYESLIHKKSIKMT